ncbi:MAG TPA: exodeoxyribonuclease III [Polyangiaceae bacterium]|nr:exodeoxyribonuclease III [Polyangiaceae bacterium]
MRLSSWNVNSIRVREPQLLDWLGRTRPDVVCLQETKVVDDDFPTDDLMRLGYAVAMSGQPTYNGVAILSRLPLKDVRIGLAGEGPDAERRAISASVGGLRVMSVYVPNGKSVSSPSFRDKLAWLERLRLTLDALEDPERPLVVCGDFNIATDERDVYAPEQFRGKLHFHPEEHRALARVKDFGLVDAFRHKHDEAGAYTWWDYRTGGFRKNEGLRIDYTFVTSNLLPRLSSASIDRETRALDKPSDHAPVSIELEDQL